MRLDLNIWVLRLLAIGIAVLGIRGIAFAQGASGEAPDPLGLREAGELFERHLDLEDSDWILIEAIHDDYLTDFATIRDGPIADFLATGRALRAANTGMMPGLKSLEAYFNAWQTVVGLVHRIDEQFFASVTATLGQDAVEGVERARRVRRRRADASAVMGAFALGDSALDDAFWATTPTDEEVAAVDDVLLGLESSTPRLVRAVAVETTEALLEIARRLDKAGFGEITEADMADDGRAQEIMEAASGAYAGVMAEIYVSWDKLLDREFAAARLFRDRLEPPRWAKVKRRWATRAFPEARLGYEIGGDGPGVSKVAARVRALLPAESRDRDSVDEMLLAWYRSDDRLTDQMIQVGRGIMRVLLEQAGPQDGLWLEDELEALASAREGLREKAIGSLLALLPEGSRQTMTADLADADSGRTTDLEGERSVGGDEAAAAGAGIEAEGAGRSRSRIVNPIAVDELELMLEILALDAADRNVARSLHGEYLDAWAAEVGAILERAAARAPYADDDAFGDEALVQNDEFLAAVEAACTLDDRLFGDFVTALSVSNPEAGLEAVRLQRIFDRSVEAEQLSSTGRFADNPPEVSPFEIIEAMDFDPATRANAIAAVIREAAGLLEAYSSVDVDRIGLARRDILDSVAHHEEEIDYVGFTTAVNRRALEVLGHGERRRAKIEVAMFEVVSPALERMPALELEFEIVDRGLSPRGDARTTSIVRDALRIPDLESGRMDTLAMILRAHLDRERILLDRARDLRLDSSRMPEIVEIEGGVSTRYDAAQAIMQEIGKLVFQRDELRERLRKRVLSTLSEEQRRRIDVSR